MNKRRSIFEDVETGKPAAAGPKGGLIDSGKSSARRSVSVWLMILFALVVLMIALGGLTRLTDSGLSITEWKPVTGAVPPMSEDVWTSEFEKYQAIPEFQLQKKTMTLAEFKSIYWWEWGHRQLGRLIGLVWAAGFLFFWLTKRVPAGWTGRLVLPGVLGGVQGAVGWWMVSSGLTGRMVDVASYRLAIHLGLAFAILLVLAWFAWMLQRSEKDLVQSRRQRDARLIRLSGILLGLAFAQVLLGALVAGIDAGRGYIDWPLMNGEFLPSESFDYEPLWTNFFENPALVQFNHRMLGYLVFLTAGLVWWQSRRSAVRATKQAFDWVMVMVFGQMVLGIGTVLYAAPWQLGIVHQIGAVVVVTLILRACFAATYPRGQSLR